MWPSTLVSSYTRLEIFSAKQCDLRFGSPNQPYFDHSSSELSCCPGVAGRCYSDADTGCWHSLFWNSGSGSSSATEVSVDLMVAVIAIGLASCSWREYRLGSGPCTCCNCSEQLAFLFASVAVVVGRPGGSGCSTGRLGSGSSHFVASALIGVGLVANCERLTLEPSTFFTESYCKCSRCSTDRSAPKIADSVCCSSE